jgi:hypothetical protein
VLPTRVAREIEEETDAERLAVAVAEMDDEERVRHDRLKREEADLTSGLEQSRERVGVAPDDLRHVVGAALSRVGFDLNKAEGEAVGRVRTYRFEAHGAPCRLSSDDTRRSAVAAVATKRSSPPAIVAPTKGRPINQRDRRRDCNKSHRFTPSPSAQLGSEGREGRLSLAESDDEAYE